MSVLLPVTFDDDRVLTHFTQTTLTVACLKSPLEPTLVVMHTHKHGRSMPGYVPVSCFMIGSQH